MNKIQYKFKVVSNRKLCPRFFCLSLDAKPILNKILPGQFIHIRVNDGLEPFFRRPFSVYRAQKYVEIFYEAVGQGTRLLSLKKSGDELDVLGPLGNHFSLPPAGTKQVVMIAGGIGIAPFLILSDHLAKKGYELILLYGGRTKDHVYPMKEFKRNGCRIFVATDDGSVGVKGRVSKLFSKIYSDPKTTMLYTCGPKAMMKVVQEFVEKYDFRCEASCEEVMACALGA
ncbi:MAG TPA: dihydroorotate dehydrogenase electron transfer subunit, partial [Candidatus Omnitrophota bacterium]|nr:dihydroorotate dehydrogenase electron transfer subunit [Candidatus Omnitrophota bacterium]